MKRFIATTLFVGLRHWRVLRWLAIPFRRNRDHGPTDTPAVKVAFNRDPTAADLVAYMNDNGHRVQAVCPGCQR